MSLHIISISELGEHLQIQLPGLDNAQKVIIESGRARICRCEA